MIRRLLLLGTSLLLLTASSWAGDKQEYIVASKRYLFAVPNASAPPALLSDAEISGLGGAVAYRNSERLIVTLPPAAADAVARHSSVKYLQKVTSGEPSDAIAAASRLVPSSERLQQAATAVKSFTYSYDGSGNVTQIAGATTDSFAYDPFGRIWTGTVSGTTESYVYDGFGNITSRTTAGQTFPMPVNHVTNHLTGYTYSAAGDVLGTTGDTYTYDSFSMVSSHDHNGVEYYVYTADDERIGVRSGNQWLWSFRDESGKVLRQYKSYADQPAAAWTWVEDYVYRDGVLVGAEREAAEGGRRHMHLDHLGTPRLITGSGGAVLSEHAYLPFGIEVTPLKQEMLLGYSREEPMRFTGHERDLSGGVEQPNTNYSDYMHARSTAPSWGRFLSVDPSLNIKANLPNPQRWNRYSYVSNNPTNKIDPDGRDELGFMDQLQREQLAVADGGLSGAQYLQRNIGRGVGATLGAIIGLVGEYVAPYGMTAFLTPSTNVTVTTTIAGIAGVESGLLGGRKAVEVQGVRFTEFYLEKLAASGRANAPAIANAILKAGSSEFKPLAVSVGRRPGETFKLYRATVNGKLWEMVYNPTTREVYHILKAKVDDIITTWR